MQETRQRPTRQQVDASVLELACARAGEHEAQVSPCLDLLVHDIEERGQLLDLVDHHDLDIRVGFDQLAQPFGSCREPTKHLGRQQIDPQGRAVLLAQPGRLSRAAGSE